MDVCDHGGASKLEVVSKTRHEKKNGHYSAMQNPIWSKVDMHDCSLTLNTSAVKKSGKSVAPPAGKRKWHVLLGASLLRVGWADTPENDVHLLKSHWSLLWQKTITFNAGVWSWQSGKVGHLAMHTKVALTCTFLVQSHWNSMDMMKLLFWTHGYDNLGRAL